MLLSFKKLKGQDKAPPGIAPARAKKWVKYLLFFSKTRGGGFSGRKAKYGKAPNFQNIYPDIH